METLPAHGTWYTKPTLVQRLVFSELAWELMYADFDEYITCEICRRLHVVS